MSGQLGRITAAARAAGSTDLEVWTLERIADGDTIRAIARERGVTHVAVIRRRDAALRKMGCEPIGEPRPAQPRPLPGPPTQWQSIIIELHDKHGHSFRHIARSMEVRPGKRETMSKSIQIQLNSKTVWEAYP